MEKIVERYTMENVFAVIEKHRKILKELMDVAHLKKNMAEILCDDPTDMMDMYAREMRDYASALACLDMLEKELKGEIEY